MAAPKDSNLRAWSVRRRMLEGVTRVVDEGLSIAEAAREVGVSRPRLSEKVKEHRARLTEAQERGAEHQRARAGLEPAAEPALGVNERRRVPSFAEFNEMYFDNVNCYDCGGIRHETPDFHKEMIAVLDDTSVKRFVTNVAPFHAKSTILSLRYPLYRICQDPNVRIALISAGSDLAADQAYQIQQHLSDPQLYEGATRNLVDDWGPFKGSDPWGRREFWVTGRSHGHRDPTVRPFGIGSKIYGRRIDDAILDDVFDQHNSKNPDTVAFNVSWITSTIESRLGQAGRLVGAGTRVSPQDGWSFLSQLPGYKFIRYPCIIDEEAGVTLWPEHFGIEAAKKKRSTMPADEWQLLYQNTDTLGSDASFTEEMLHGVRDHDRHLGQFDPSWHLVCGLDPAGANKQSGYTALIMEGVDIRTGRRYLVDMVNQSQLKAPQLRDQLFMWAEQYRGAFRELRVESNGLQSQLVQYNEEIVMFLTNRGIRVVPHITTKHNKWDPQFGVESMAPMFYNKTISIPYGDISTRKKVQELERQLLQFPIGQVTDLYMALWFAELGCREQYQRALISPYDPKARVPKRLRGKRRIIDFATGENRPPTEAELSGWHPRWESDDTPDPTQKPRLINVGVDA